MSIKTETFTLGGTDFELRQIPARKSRRVLTKLVNLLSQAGEGGNMVEVFKSLDPDDVDFFCDEFAAHTTVKIGAAKLPLSEQFDNVFTGRLEVMGEWLITSVNFNYSSFLAALKARSAESQAESESP